MSNFFQERLSTISDFLATQRFPTDFWHNIFSWQYWTDSNLSTQPSYLLFGLVSIVVVLVALILWRQRIKAIHKRVPVYDVAINQLASLIIFIFLITLAYIFFRSQGLAYLSSRLVVLATALVIVIWVSWIIHFTSSIVPSKRRHYLERERFFRYLPKMKGDQ